MARFRNKIHLVYEAMRQITTRYIPQIRVIKDGHGYLLTQSGDKEKMEAIFVTLYNDPNAANVDYNKKHFGSHSNTRDKELLNIDRGEIEEAIKRVKHRKTSGVDVVEELKLL